VWTDEIDGKETGSFGRLGHPRPDSGRVNPFMPEHWRPDRHLVGPGDCGGDALAMKKFSEATAEVISLAEELIGKYHPNLDEARIAFVFQDEATETNGRIILGTTTKVSPKMQPFMEYDFLIVIAEDRWIASSRQAHEALIDHELCHCGGDSLNGWKLRHHDVEEFFEVIERHGAWKSDLFKLQNIMQPGLPGIEEARPTKQGTVTTLTGQQLSLISKKVTKFKDDLLEEARKFKAEEGEITISKLQRKLRISYPKAQKLIELLETAGA
jgi:DNA segregation ATPase FtsK/SpoIIIE-like protein